MGEIHPRPLAGQLLGAELRYVRPLSCVRPSVVRRGISVAETDYVVPKESYSHMMTGSETGQIAVQVILVRIRDTTGMVRGRFYSRPKRASYSPYLLTGAKLQ